MGYYTYFSFFMEGDKPGDKDKVINFLEQNCPGVIDWVFDKDLDTYGEASWWDEERDMRALSRAFPHIHFTIHGDGEDREDVWDAHYLNGKRQLCYEERKMPEFNPAELE